MPRYRYHCTACKETNVIQHLSSEVVSDCQECEELGTMTKLLSRFTTAPKSKGPKKIGQVTEEFISSARDDLKQQKLVQEEKL